MEGVVNAMPWPLYPRERPGTHCIGGWVGTRDGLDGCGKSCPTGIRYPDRPALSESLDRLSYPGPLEFRYRNADNSLARPTSRCILFDGENISFDASLVLYICIILIF